jgi:hypothetical protein
MIMLGQSLRVFDALSLIEVKTRRTYAEEQD